MKSLKSNKACGLEKQPIYKKYNNDLLLPVYVNLLNSILDSSEIPNDCFLGKISSIFKNSGSPNDSENYLGIKLSIIKNRLLSVRLYT